MTAGIGLVDASGAGTVVAGKGMAGTGGLGVKSQEGWKWIGLWGAGDG